MNEDNVTASLEENKRLRLESNRQSFKQTVVEEKGYRCVNCGSDENVELHHIVPIFLGGTNNISNIVPLCHACHAAAHNGQHMSNYQDFSKCCGRPPKKPDEEVFPVLDRYAAGEIGTKKVKELLDLTSAMKITDMAQYKRYLRDRGIKRLRNNIDIKIAKGSGIALGDIVGAIWYIDGRYKVITYIGEDILSSQEQQRLQLEQDRLNAEKLEREGFSALDMYVSGAIGAREAKIMLGLPDSDDIEDADLYKRYISARGIEKICNNIDLRIENGIHISTGDVVGQVWYVDKSYKDMRYHPLRAREGAAV